MQFVGKLKQKEWITSSGAQRPTQAYAATSVLLRLTHSQSTLCIPASSAMEGFELQLQSMRSLPTLLSIPGTYSDRSRDYRGRLSLVRMQSAIAAKKKQVQRIQEETGALPTGHVFYPSWEVEKSIQRQDRTRGLNAHRFMPMIRFPFLDREPGKLDYGISCQPCRVIGTKLRRLAAPRGMRFQFSERVYLAEDFMEHFQSCEIAQKVREELRKYMLASGGDHCMPEAQFSEILRSSRFERQLSFRRG